MFYNYKWPLQKAGCVEINKINIGVTDFVFIGNLEGKRQAVNDEYDAIQSGYDKIEGDILSLSNWIDLVTLHELNGDIVFPSKEIHSIIANVLEVQYSNIVNNFHNILDATIEYKANGELLLHEEERIENIRFMNQQRQLRPPCEVDLDVASFVGVRKTIFTTIKQFISYIFNMFKR